MIILKCSAIVLLCTLSTSARAQQVPASPDALEHATVAQGRDGGEKEGNGLLNNPTVAAAIVAAAISALVGLGVSIYTLRWNRQEAEKTREFQRKEAEAARAFRREEAGSARLFEGLRYFEKGTKKRSIGLAIVESNWDLAPRRRRMWVAVLTNLAVYLLVEKENTPAHESANLKRIRALLTRGADLLSTGQKSELREALSQSDVEEEERKKWKTLL